jgi:hypothetical protein
MPPTPDGDPADHHRHARRRHHRCRPHGSSTPARATHHRRRTAARTLVRGHPYVPRPTTLWPFAGADPLPGVALLTGWLARTIVTLVTTYTRPGDRVLLLSPPALAQQPSTTHHGTLHGALVSASYAGLSEAVWTLIRLGRGVDTAAAAPAPEYPENPDTPVDSLRRSGVESESRPRPNPRPRTDRHESEHLAARAVQGPDDRFDLIITAVHPHDTDWLAHTDWAAILTTTGTLATVTHSVRRHGWLLDPIATVADTFRDCGLRWLDHIAVLTEHLPDPAHTTDNSPPNPASIAARPAAPPAEPLPLRAVHHDLLLFKPEVPGTTGASTRITGDLG